MSTAASGASLAAPGRLLAGRYRLTAELGRGGLGIVYRAHDTLLDRDVAVKIVDKPDLSDADRQRLLHEARLAARLSHPNIITVHDAGEIDQAPYIVMECVEGASAHTRPPQSLIEALSTAGQLCRALAHAHAHGVVHRDLKPENILHTAEGAVKLADFGLALSPVSKISRDGLIVGTVYYMAPEQIRGEAIDGRSDLYALGILLYEWTTGELPFTADDSFAVLTQHLYSPVVPPRARVPDLPPTLDRLIVRLLSKRPDDRPASADDVLAVLESPEAGSLEGRGPDIPLLEQIQRGRMAGRALELQQARRLWSRACTGTSCTLLISGEPGIGKSRLVRELVAQAEAGRAVILQGWNAEQPNQPFAIFRQMLRGALREVANTLAVCPEAVIGDLVEFLPEAGELFPEIEVSPASGVADAQHRLFESVAVLVSVISRSAPVLLIFEDAQWTDSGSLNLLGYLIQQIRDRPVLFLVTYRPAQASEAPDLVEVLHDLQRRQVAETLRLERLGKAATEEMLHIMFGGDLDPGFVDAVYRAAEGNPFFVEEVSKGMVESRRLAVRDGRWQLTGDGRPEVPPNVRAAIRSRVRAMPAETRRALEAAAVRGAEFEAEIVRQVCRLDPAAVGDALDPAERAEIVRRVGNGNRPRFAFTHSLIPAAMVEDLRPIERRSLHGEVARVLSVIEPDEVESLAYHYHTAGETDRAVHYLLLAGDRAHAVCACREAIDAYSAAAALQRRSGSTETLARTLLKLGLACSANFQFDQARRAYEEAFEHWEKFLDAGAAPGRPSVALRYAVDEPVSLDPGLAGDDASTFVLGQVMEGLLDIDEAWGIVPAVAARWDVSDDGRQYVFRLRRGWTWSDGERLTARDFEYAWKRNLGLASSSGTARLLYVLEKARAFAEGRASVDEIGVRAVNDHTLEVRLERPASYFPQLLTHPVTFPLPRRIVEGDRQPWTAVGTFVGNGAFRLTEWIPGRSMTLERSLAYRGLFGGNVSRVEAPIVGAYDPLLEAFDAGKLDGISLLHADPETLRRLKTAYRRRFTVTPALTTVYLAFDCSRAPFDRPEIRKAFAQAIDRTAVLAVAGASRPSPGGFLPPGMPGHDASVGLRFDPVEAGRRLGDAGYPSGETRTELLYVGRPGAANPIPGFLIRSWEEALGVTVEPVGVEWGEWLRRRDHDPAAISISGWTADFPDPDDMLRGQFHSREGTNAVRWSHAAFDELTEQAASGSDRRQRIELYRRADRILVEDEAAIVPLWYSQGRRLAQPDVTLPPVPSLLMRFKHVVVERDTD